MPAAAASAEPSANVKPITTSGLIPISAAVRPSKETARMAAPILVWKMSRWRPTMSSSVAPKVTAWRLPRETSPKVTSGTFGTRLGKNCGAGPMNHGSWPAAWMNIEMPIAVMSALRRGLSRSGR